VSVREKSFLSFDDDKKYSSQTHTLPLRVLYIIKMEIIHEKNILRRRKVHGKKYIEKKRVQEG
jgi:hypothetical protein